MGEIFTYNISSGLMGKSSTIQNWVCLKMVNGPIWTPQVMVVEETDGENDE